eukprot:gene32387-39979_t
MVRRTKDQVLKELPEKRREIRNVDPDPEYLPQLRAIQAQSKRLEDQLKNNPQMDPADFQKLTNEKQQLLTQMYGVTGYSKIRAIKDELVKLIEESRAERGVALSKKEIGATKAAPSAGSFCLAVIACSLIWWVYKDDWPEAFFAAPYSRTASLNNISYANTPLLTVDLIFLYVLYLNGLVTSLSNLAVLTRKDRQTPRGRWIFIMSGLFTIIAGLLSAPPILISPESSASIKAGAKTGLSTVVPIFEAVPAAGTSPVLIMI